MSMRDCLDCEYYSEYTQECSLNELPESCIESERRTMSECKECEYFSEYQQECIWVDCDKEREH